MHGEPDLAAVERLFGRRRMGIRPGLDTEQRMLKELGNPERTLAAIHVAGTNGKGSVAALLESVFRAAGMRTGLYTSPHLVRFNERFRVDGADIADGDLFRLVARIEGVAEAVAGRTGAEATFFECATALAFLYFRERGVRLAVVETGMGGRLDATNVLLPLVAVITRIGLDHVAFLGSGLEAIAREKAGIVKAGRPVVCGAMPPEAARVIRNTAAELKSPLIDAQEQVSVQVAQSDMHGHRVRVQSGARSTGILRLPLAGAHQLENLATAVCAVDVVQNLLGVDIKDAALKAGLEQVRWPGRFQVLREDPLVVLDVAHNPDGAERLAATLRSVRGHRKVGLVTGMCTDKDAAGFFVRMAGEADAVWTVPLRTERGMAAGTLARLADRLPCVQACGTLAEGLLSALAWCEREQGLVCVCGSVYLAGELIEGWDAASGTFRGEETP